VGSEAQLRDEFRVPPAAPGFTNPRLSKARMRPYWPRHRKDMLG
jgi:hypothetical protein